MGASAVARRRAAVVSAIGLVAGALVLPVIGGGSTAQAAHVSAPATVQITPESDSAAVGVCNQYTVVVRDADGDPTPGVVMDVHVTEGMGDGVPNNQQDIDFCQVSGRDEPAKAAPTDVKEESSQLRQDTDKAEYTTDENGQFIFGIVGTSSASSQVNQSNTATIRAFHDVDGDDTFDSGEPNDTASKTFTPGGDPNTPEGREEAQNNVETVDAEPQSDTNVVGERHEMTVTTENSAGDPVAGVTVRFRVTSGPNTMATPQECDTLTDNTGRTICGYTGTNPGTDSIIVWVNQTDNTTGGGTTAGRDPDEPFDRVSKTYIAQNSVSGVRVDLVCNSGDANQARTSPEDCVNPTTSPTETFTAVLTADTNNDGTYTTGEVPQGTEVRFAENGPDATVSPTQCTATNGSCSTTLTERTPTSGEVITVTATVLGQNAANDTQAGQQTTDSGTKTFRNVPSDARNIDLKPDTGQFPTGGTQSLTATVTDAAGKPVQGVQVTFTEDGPGSLQGDPVQITNDSGQASISVTMPSGVSGIQSVTATISGYQGVNATGVDRNGVVAGRTTGTTGTQARDDHCESEAGTVPNGQGTGNNRTPGNSTPDSAPGAPAGNCSDTSVFGLGTTTPTPTATPTVSPHASGTATGSPSSSASPTRTSTGTPTTTATPQPCQNVTAVSITVNVQRITSGNAPTLSGTVERAGGQVARNCAVTLFAKNYIQTAYEAVATTETDDTGRYLFQVRPVRQTSFIARSGATQSRSLVVFVSARVNLVRPAAGQVLPRSYCFTGDLDPNAPDFRGAAVGLAKVGRDAAGRPTFAVIGQTATRNDAGATFTLCPQSRQLADGVYVIFTSARNGLLKGSVSQTINTA